MFVNKFLNLWKLMGFTNVFVGCNLFNMYAKSGNKKYGMKWLLLFVIQKVILEWANTTLFLFFLGLILVTFKLWCNFQVWFSQSTNVSTHIVVVMEASDECMCSNTNALESQSKYIHEQTIDNE